MIELLVVVEGATEEEFVRRILAPHLEGYGIHVKPIVVATKRERNGRKLKGGGDWSKWYADIRRITIRPGLFVTTLFDLYGLPKAFPGLERHANEPNTVKRVELLEQELASAFTNLGFIPYLQRHEFEALVLAALPSLEELLEAPDDRAGAAKLRQALGDTPPEDVNDGADTAPSKRLLAFIPGYEKPLHGPLAIEAAGLASLLARCPRFRAWVARLEALGAGVSDTGA